MNPASQGKGCNQFSDRSRPLQWSRWFAEVAALMVLCRPHPMTCHPSADVPSAQWPKLRTCSRFFRRSGVVG